MSPEPTKSPRKPSLLERSRESRGALIVGCGGGGDIVQTLAVRNYLERLGVERFVLGELAVKWWDRPGRIPLGAEISRLSWYDPAEQIAPHAVLVGSDTTLTAGLGRGEPLYEAEVARVTGLPTVAFGVEGGNDGILESCKEVMDRYNLDLFITADIGADAFFSGFETTVQSPMVDAFSLNAARHLDGYYALAGYGCDAEMSAAHLERSMARVMSAGGYLGAHGITPEDLVQLDAVLKRFPDEPVEIWPREAARGALGTQLSKGWWTMDVTPLAAVVLFFDPETIATVNPIPDMVAGTATATEAEDAILEGSVLIPETRLPHLVEVPTETQIDDADGTL